MELDRQVLNTVLPLYYLLSKYHDYEIKNIERVPNEGRCLIGINHSFATYDGFLLAMGIYIETGRTPNILADSNFFKFESIREVCKRLNMVEANHPNAEDLLNKEQLVYVAPGGMKEALRSAQERYRIHWENRTGLARLSINSQTPIILAACPKSDEIFDIYPTPFTDFIYKNFKLPFVMLRGIGKTIIPRPVKLIHYISAPIHPPKIDRNDHQYNEVVKKYHQQVVTKMQRLLARTKDL